MTQFIKTMVRHSIILSLPVLLLSLFLSPAKIYAQSTFLPQGSKFEHFLDRMEILQQTDPELNITTVKPISRKSAVRMAELADSLAKFYPYDDYYHLSRVDQASLASLLMNNTEWVNGSRDSFQSKRPWLNTFYKTKTNFYEVNENDFFLAINPAIQQTQSYETGNKERVFLNSKGLTLRGRIGDKLGFKAPISPTIRKEGRVSSWTGSLAFHAGPGRRIL